MAINKVVYGNNTLIDLTSDTVTADKLMQGYTAHDASGTIITGTATGGGGGSVTQDQDGFIILPPDGGGSPSVSGLEYETGTWTPSEDTNTAEISFEKTHDAPPAYVSLFDVTGADSATWQSYTLYGWTYVNSADLFGNPFPKGDGDSAYGYVSYARRTASSSLSISSTSLTTSSSDPTDSIIQNSRYNVTETGFKAYGNNATTMWRTVGTYKWIAIWAPTT